MTTVTDSDSEVSFTIKDQETASPPMKRAAAQKINAPLLYQLKGTPAECQAGLERAIAKGCLVLHESGIPGTERFR